MARRPSQLAVIPVGNADGYSPALRNCGGASIRERSASGVGRGLYEYSDSGGE